ncbi:S-layer homology domain-containing protein, partial [Candidatus Saccharibacteria bacterium]|nr:S-layer homology domain-containing protein [Candidatus Saccharibacteria bacterium]
DKLSVHFLGTERQWSGIEIDNDFDQISNCYYSNAILNATISFVGEPVIVVDEPSSWAIDALGKAAQKGIPSDRRVGYKCNCPRIEFAHYVADMFRAVTGESLAQLAKEQGMGLSASYKDTSDVDVLALTALGIFRGGGNNMFFPERTLTRGESATVLTRAARVLGVDVDSAPKNCFPDVDCSWIELDWLAFTGIAKGTDKGLFEPGRTLVAQEALLFVSRLYNVVDPAGDLSAGFLLYCHISYAKMD